MNKREITFDVTDSLSLITMDGLDAENISRIFDSAAKRGIYADMISMSLRHRNKLDLSYTVPAESLGKAVASMGEARHSNPSLMCHISGNNAKITLSGCYALDKLSITSQIIGVLADNNIPVKLVSASADEISVLTDEFYADKAVMNIRKYLKNRGV